MTRAVWERPEVDAGAVRALERGLGVRRLTARVLAARGYGEVEAARRFLRAELEELSEPWKMRDMGAAVERLKRAIGAGEKILIYGDYDVDGTAAVVILRKAIELAGGEAATHVPHRLKDGYGMRAGVIERAAEAGFGLIVSVDTGIRAGEVVRGARERGLDVIVTDHHLPEEELPPAVAVLNPNRRDCGYPDKGLCGAGVALQLVRGLMEAAGWSAARVAALTESFLKMAAIATVADVVPLTGENRVIVKHGLAGLAQVKSVGLRALLDVSGIHRGMAPTATEVAFRVAPRINAAGRMASAEEVIELLLTNDAGRAREIAGQLHELNQERQETEQAIVKQVVEECEKAPVTEAEAALVFAGRGWHRGVVGIVASRLVERYGRPVFVLGVEEGVAQGSGRSAAGFHLLGALEAMPELFTRFGGHAQAAGVTMEESKVEEFRRRLREYAGARLKAEDFRPRIGLDAEADWEEIDARGVLELMELAPFGFGNPRPLVEVRGLEVAWEPEVVKEKHLKVKLRRGGQTATAMGWGMAERKAEMRRGARVDAALHLEEDKYGRARGWEGWQAVLRDVRPAE